jgi:hypothetical protein
VLVYVAGGVPLIYTALDHLLNPSIDANIGLGITFMYTWLFSAITFLIFILKIVLKREKK